MIGKVRFHTKDADLNSSITENKLAVTCVIGSENAYCALNVVGVVVVIACWESCW